MNAKLVLPNTDSYSYLVNSDPKMVVNCLKEMLVQLNYQIKVNSRIRLKIVVADAY